MQSDVLQVQPARPFTVFEAAALKAWLLEQLEAGPQGLRLDLSNVEQIDTAGVQLLLMLQREAESRSCPLSVVAPSKSVREVFGLLGLSEGLRAMSAPDHDQDARGQDG